MIYLTRHGQTEFNSQLRLQGRLDSPLTARGVEEAWRMGRVLKLLLEPGEDVAVIASPLGRTLRTAEIICEAAGLDCPIASEPRLAELDVGGWEGLTREEIEAASPGATGAPGWIFTAPEGETYEDVAARAGDWLQGVDETDGRRRVVISHGITGRVLRGLYAGASREQVLAQPPPPQHAVFRLWSGVVGRMDEGFEE